MKISFVRREKLAPGIWQYWYKPERPVDFVPGQYADFHILTPLSDPRGQSRTFTLTSQPRESTVSFVVKLAKPLSLYKATLQTLKVGDKMRLDEAMGDLVLPKATNMPLVFAAGGIGIASYISSANYLKSNPEQRPIKLFYCLRNSDEQIFHDCFTLFHTSVIIAPNRLTVKQLLADQTDQTLYYLSGSQKFVEGLQTGLEASSIPRERIVFDYYDGYADL
ncbi:MAG: FAD-dependent oxidoreductase [Candidatus Saccharimonadales bacterium]